MKRKKCIHNTASFSLGGLVFEYDEEKERLNKKKHGISFRMAARVFFDEDYIEETDQTHTEEEQRYNVIGDTSAGNISETVSSDGHIIIGNVERFAEEINDILYVVYTERIRREESGKPIDVIRLISARLATNFERGLYYGQYI